MIKNIIIALASFGISYWLVFWFYPRVVMLYALSKGFKAMAKANNKKQK